MSIKYWEAHDYEDCRFFPQEQKEMVAEIADREGLSETEVEKILVGMADQASDADFNRRG